MKLLVSDFDGTYFIDDISIKENNAEIKKFREKGNLFMLSSGRSFKSLKEMTKKYKIEYDYLSCCDGSILYDKNDNILIKFDLDMHILSSFLKLKKYAKIERIQYSYPGDYYKRFHGNTLIGCNFVIKNTDITEQFIKKYHELESSYPNYDFLVYKHDDVTFFCLKNKGINKSSTVNFIKEKLNLQFKDIYTIGDNENDYYMLKLFNGYFIGNPEDKIKKVSIKGYNQVSELLKDIEKSSKF